jgi:hypothetical protein
LFPHADTEVDYCFIAEDNICRLIIKPETSSGQATAQTEAD